MTDREMTAFAEKLMRTARGMADTSAERSELVAASVGAKAAREGWTKEQLKKWFRTGYGKVFVRLQDLVPGLDMKDIQKIAAKSFDAASKKLRRESVEAEGPEELGRISRVIREVSESVGMKDLGPEPCVVDVERDTLLNEDFIRARWTGKYLQMTLMSIGPGKEIGLEVHEDHDQFIRIEQGQAMIVMGKDKEALDFVDEASEDFAVFIPAGYWHNVTNTGEGDLKLYSIYSPPEHDHGTIK